VRRPARTAVDSAPLVGRSAGNGFGLLRFQARFLKPRIDLGGHTVPKCRIDGDQGGNLRMAQMGAPLEELAEGLMRIVQERRPEVFVGHESSNHTLDTALRHSSSSLRTGSSGKRDARERPSRSLRLMFRRSIVYAGRGQRADRCSPIELHTNLQPVRFPTGCGATPRPRAQAASSSPKLRASATPSHIR
jgi:hypothetical protein